MARAANMQSLTGDIKRRYPGVTVYGIGDAAHKTRASDHNEDDTAGSKAAQSDPDGRAEHRAIDVMIGPAFTKADGDRLVAAMLADPAARSRLYGIIWHGSQWWRSTGWVRQSRTSDPHNDHVHFSGYAPDDENGAGWPAVNGGGGVSVAINAMFCAKDDNGEVVQFWQVALKQAGFYTGAEDGDYGDKTAAAVGAARKAVGSSVTNGQVIDAHAANQILIHFVRHWAPVVGPKGPVGPIGPQGIQGPAGPVGPAGPAGRDGLLALPERVVLEAVIQQPDAR